MCTCNNIFIMLVDEFKWINIYKNNISICLDFITTKTKFKKNDWDVIIILCLLL